VVKVTLEGGEDPKRFQKEINGDSKIAPLSKLRRDVLACLSINKCKEIQIKWHKALSLSEGRDSYLEKSSAMDRRGTKLNAYVGLISPPPHHDIYSIEDLSQLIFDLKMPTVKHV
jgi:glutamate synthase (ferredoxin)